MATRELVLQNCTIEGNVVKLPEGEQLERALYLEVKKEFQFYGTPEKLCNILCEHAFDAWENKRLRVLEPSAGQGSILDSVLKWFDTEAMNVELKEITAIELMEDNHKVLVDKYSDNNLINILKMDFLEYDEYINYYDVVIANPPFSNNQDIKHFYKMFEVCKPGGVVVSIMSTGFIYNSGKIHKEFREFIGMGNTGQQRADAKIGTVFTATSECGFDQVVYVQKFEEGEFKSSGTNVHTALVVMKKNCITGF